MQGPANHRIKKQKSHDITDGEVHLLRLYFRPHNRKIILGLWGRRSFGTFMYALACGMRLLCSHNLCHGRFNNRISRKAVWQLARQRVLLLSPEVYSVLATNVHNYQSQLTRATRRKLFYKQTRMRPSTTYSMRFYSCHATYGGISAARRDPVSSGGNENSSRFKPRGTFARKRSRWRFRRCYHTMIQCHGPKFVRSVRINFVLLSDHWMIDKGHPKIDRENTSNPYSLYVDIHFCIH